MSASGQSGPIVNELLAFLQQKLLLEGIMDTASAVQICSTSFTVDDICAAKKVLYQSLGMEGTFVPHRRGDEAGVKSLEDIIRTLRNNEDNMSVFVTTGDNNLPSYIPDHVDVSCLLKEIVALKTSLAEVLRKFELSEKSIAELRKEFVLLRNSAPLTRTPSSNFASNDRRDTGVLPSDALGIPLSADTVKTVDVTAVAPPACPPRLRPAPANNVSSKLRQRGYADAVAGQPVRANQVKAPSKACEKASSKKETNRTNVDEEGFTLVSRKSKARRAPRKTLCGTADPVSSGLRVATLSKALYVSRLHHSATVNDVVEYVTKKTGYTLRVFQLQSRHYVHFSSFVVRVPRPLQDTIACADFWPKGVVFRKFRGNLPNPAPEKTMLRSHAVLSPK